AGPGSGALKLAPGGDLRPRTRMPAGGIASTRPDWCSVSTPVMWSSSTITSSRRPSHCCANMPAAAEPHAHLFIAVDDGRLAGLDDQGMAAVDAHGHRRARAELKQRVAGDGAF